MFCALVMIIAFSDITEEQLPALAERDRFPPAKAIQEALDFNKGYQDYLATQHVWQPYREAELFVMECETRWLRTAWEILSQVDNEEYCERARRQALDDLREHIGIDAWSTGTMPPCVPIWRFRQIDLPITHVNMTPLSRRIR